MSSDLFSVFTAMSPFAAVGYSWKMAARMQIETVALMSRRAQALMELPATLASCSSAQDLLTEHVKFCQLAQRQYAQSIQKVTAAAPSSTVVAPDVQPKVRDYMVVSDRDVKAVPRETVREQRAPLAQPAQKIRRSA
jgi:hypothetical protein